MKAFILLLCLTTAVVHAGPEEDGARRTAYAYARAQRSVEGFQQAASDAVWFGPRACAAAYAAMAKTRGRVFITYTLGVVGAYTAVMGSMVYSWLDQQQFQRLARSMTAIKEFPISDLDDDTRKKTAEALAKGELQLMLSHHRLTRTIARNLYYPWDEKGTPADQSLAIELGKLHAAELVPARGHEPVDLTGMDGETGRYLPLWHIEDYFPARARLFEEQLKKAKDGTVREALAPYLYNFRSKQSKQLGLSDQEEKP